jgi:hydroxycarboxylate dehydrogenase B
MLNPGPNALLRTAAVPTFDANRLTRFASTLFQTSRVPADEADIVAASLVGANLAGHDSHGLIRVVQYVRALSDGLLRSGVPVNIVSDSPAVLVADGGWGLGQVQAHRLLAHLLTRAASAGLAAGTLRHCGHVGRLGEYGEAATAAGFAFLGTVNNHGLGRGVAPPGGKEARIGTNPLCLAVPTANEPVVLDIGTSVCAEGKVRVLFNKGQPVPEGWLLDANGKPTTDPGVLYREPSGTIRPLGGDQAYKGFGLGLLLDMLVGGLSGAPCSTPGLPYVCGNAVLFLVLDPRRFAGADHFRTEVTRLAGNVRSCPKADGVDVIRLPGDPERHERARRQAEGIRLDEGTWKQLATLAERLGVPLPQATETSP